MHKIYMIKTNKECFITDCEKTSGYNYDYHRTILTKLYFDGKAPKESFCKNWYVIDKYPDKIEIKKEIHTNQRYEIINSNMICEKLPQIIKYKESDNFPSDIFDLYDYTYNTEEKLVLYEDYEIEVLMEIDNFKQPNKINYDIITKSNFTETKSIITNKDVKHQLLDKIIFPEIMLHTRPCKLSSKQMFDITRQYIKENIDLSKAKITSDYDFCFAVEKIIPLIEPETVSYSNIFARTKKERNKIHYKTVKYKSVAIFSMTHNQENYRGYTAIDSMSANNENELKEKVDTWLKGLIEIINKPLEMCPHCNGTGYLEEIKFIDANKRD